MKKCKIFLVVMYFLTICSPHLVLAQDNSNEAPIYTLHLIPRPNGYDSKTGNVSESKSFGEMALKSVGSFFGKQISNMLFSYLLDASGLKQIIFGANKEDKIQDVILNNLYQSKKAIEAVSVNVERNHNEMKSAIASLALENERFELRKKIENMNILIDSSDQTSSVMGFYYSSKISEDLKRFHAKRFIVEKKHYKILEDIVNLHSMYKKGGYLDKLAKAYLMSAQETPNVRKIANVFEKFQDEYGRLALYEIQLEALYALNRSLTLEVGDEAEKQQAEMDLNHFAIKWKEFAREHQQVYMKNVAMIAASVGSQFETLTWINGSPKPLAEFSYVLRDAGKFANDILSAHDASFVGKKHFYMLVREVDAKSILPDDTKAEFIALAGVCFRGIRRSSYLCNDPEDYSPFYKRKATIEKIEIETPSSFGYLKVKDSKAYLEQTNKWVLYDISYDTPVNNENIPYENWYSSLDLSSAKASKYTRFPGPLPCFEKKDQTSCLFSIDARFAGPSSSELAKLPYDFQESKFKTSWFSYNKKLEGDKLLINHKFIPGGDTDAGSDYFVRAHILPDQPFYGKVYGSSITSTKMLKIQPNFTREEKKYISCCFSARDWKNDNEDITINRTMKFGNLNLLNDIKSVADLPCSKNDEFTTELRDISADKVFPQFKDLAIREHNQDWQPFNLSLEMQRETDLFFQFGHNNKRTYLQLKSSQDAFIDLSAGLSGLNFFTPAKLGE